MTSISKLGTTIRITTN